MTLHRSTGGASGRATAAVTLLAITVLGILAALRPELGFVDFIPFAARAAHLVHGRTGDVPVLDGGDLVHGLYPIGYPLLLGLGQTLFGDVLVAGKVLAVLAGGVAVAAAARCCGAGAALWMLGQGVFLLHGSTEGTDLPAAAFALAALAAVHAGRSILAGALAGAAVMMRYTGVAVVPMVLLAAPSRPRALAALIAATSPHWAIAAWTGASVWPDQTQNLHIAAGHPTRLWSIETLTRWPGGACRAAAAGLGTWPAAISAMGLLVGVIRRDRRALLLFGYAATHILLLGLAFSNPRLSLPVTLCAALGAGWLLPTRFASPRFARIRLDPVRLLLLAAGLLLVFNVRPIADPVTQRAAAAAVVASTMEGPCLTTSPWLYQRRDGWLIPAIDVSGLRVAPLTPETLHRAALREGAACIGLDIARTRGAWPGLAPLLGGGAVPGYRRLDDPTGWRIWAVEPDPLDTPGVPR